MATSVIAQNEQLEKQNKILSEEIMMKEELIPGMEKMIAYLQKVQQENKKLKEDLKLSEDKVCELTHEGTMDGIHTSKLAEEIMELEAKNEKLQEENNKLKKKMRQMILEEQDDGEEWDGWYNEA